MKATVKYQVATYKGEETVYFEDEYMDNEAVIAIARKQVLHKCGGFPSPLCYESWKVVERIKE